MQFWTIFCVDGGSETIEAPNLETAWELADSLGIEIDSICASEDAYTPSEEDRFTLE